MEQPEKKKFSEEPKRKTIADIQEIKELIKAIVEESDRKFIEIDDPLDSYSLALKMHWFQDEKKFSQRLIRGYEALLEQIIQGA